MKEKIEEIIQKTCACIETNLNAAAEYWDSIKFYSEKREARKCIDEAKYAEKIDKYSIALMNYEIARDLYRVIGQRQKAETLTPKIKELDKKLKKTKTQQS